MNSGPSDKAIAQAFWTIYQELGAGSDPVFSATVLDIISSARDIDAQSCATPDKREVSESANSEWVMVPREPTPKMIDATFNDPIETNGEPESHNTRNKRIFKAMIAAADTPPRNTE